VRRGHRLLERAPTVGERPAGEVVLAEREQVERDEARRRLLGQQVDPRRRRVDPLLQHLELQPRPLGDEQLAVEHAPAGQLLERSGDDLGEVAGQRLGVAARQLDLVAVLEYQAAEPVPLGLEAQALDVVDRVLARVGDALDALGEHRPHRWHHGKVHDATLAAGADAALPQRSRLRAEDMTGSFRKGTGTWLVGQSWSQARYGA
jgi:hypothetical protein